MGTVFKSLTMDSDGEQNSPEGGEAYEKFRGQRRNTDFSQADNDLKRFLSEREENKEGSNENIQPIITNAKRDIFPTKVFGSVEKLDDIITNSNSIESSSELESKESLGIQTNSPPRCGSLGTKDLQNLRLGGNKGCCPAPMSPQINNRRFRMENSEFCSSEHQDPVNTDDAFSLPVIENPEHQTLWYSKYFLGKFHHNYVGQDNEKSPFVLSVVEEKSFGKSLCRCILWTKDGPKRLVIQGAQKTRSAKTILGQFGFNEHINKERLCLLRHVQHEHPEQCLDFGSQ